MPPLRKTPLPSALTKVAFALIVSIASLHGKASAQTLKHPKGPKVSISTKASSRSSATLSDYYRGIEKQLVTRGYLRSNRRPAKLNSDVLASNFMAIAMRSEYSLKGGGISRSGHATHLRRWEQPVRIGVLFGSSVSAAQKRADLTAIRGVAARLKRASEHPVKVVDEKPNFHILVLNDQERANARPLLKKLVPSLSRAAQNAVVRMQPNVFCMVIAVPGKTRLEGYQKAIAVVRAEHPPVMRQSCMEEELAQGMGLANDSREAWPSIFNDDEEFGVLTHHDELLLKMLYHDSLSPGMSARAVSGQVKALAQKMLGSG